MKNKKAKAFTLGFRSGEQYERERILDLLRPHLKVCNYKAVMEEDCDVCHWVKTTIKQINGKLGVAKQLHPSTKREGLQHISDILDNLFEGH